MKELSEDDYNIVLLAYIAEIITKENVPDKVRALRYSALQSLKCELEFFKRQGYCYKLLFGIAKKKGEMILQISTKTEMLKLLHPQPPHYDGMNFYASEYLTPEEELIAWSQVTAITPIKTEAFNRFMELFQTVFPEEFKKLFPQGVK